MLKKKLKFYLVKSTIEIETEAENEKEAKEIFWANVRGCRDDIDTLVNDNLEVKEL